MAYVRYLLRFARHKWYVIVYGLQVGGVPLWQLIIHDASKLSPAEYGAYTRRYFSKKWTEAEWKSALEHHFRNNPHHWEYWSVYKPQLTPMPEVYVREMVADWHAASKVYGKPVSEWLFEEYPKQRFHDETLMILVPLLTMNGVTIPEAMRSHHLNIQMSRS